MWSIKRLLPAGTAALLLALSPTGAFAEKPADSGHGHGGPHGQSAQHAPGPPEQPAHKQEPAAAPSQAGQNHEPAGAGKQAGQGHEQGSAGRQGGQSHGPADQQRAEPAAERAGPASAVDSPPAGSDAAPHVSGNQHDGPGDNNRGDVWVDQKGATGEPGHENDPQLGCGSFNIYGAGLADASGTYAIYSMPPTGHKSLEHDGDWKYTTAGVQVINADQPITLPNGHYKLVAEQDPVKHKVFWVHCGGSSSTGDTDDKDGKDDGRDGKDGKDGGHHDTSRDSSDVSAGGPGGATTLAASEGTTVLKPANSSSASVSNAAAHSNSPVSALAATGSVAIAMLLAGLILITAGLTMAARSWRRSS